MLPGLKRYLDPAQTKLLQRRAVLVPQGLRRLQGLRLGRAVKDLRELEGSFIVKDSSRWCLQPVSVAC